MIRRTPRCGAGSPGACATSRPNWATNRIRTSRILRRRRTEPVNHFSRRTALASLPATGLLGATAVSGATAAHAAPAPHTGLPAAPSGRGKVRFAFLADTHADPENDESLARLRAVFEAIDDFDPSLVIHGGDVTEQGTEAEVQAFEGAIPSGLHDRVAAVPGNHETDRKSVV